jgi:tetratricopeptide (TPR) repeat protein
MEKKLTILLMVPLFLCWHWFQPIAKKNLRGIRAYQQQNFEEALKEFMSAKGIRPNSSALTNNTASTLYQMKKYKEALEEFSQIDMKKTNLSKADLYYNMGNSLYRLNQYEKALEAYKSSLIENPRDFDAKKNYELTLKKLEDKNKKNQQNKKNQDQKNQQQQQKQKKHKNIMQYLNQNEKKLMKKKKRQIGIARKEKDW